MQWVTARLLTDLWRIEFGADVRREHTGDALSRLYALVMGLPFKLQ